MVQELKSNNGSLVLPGCNVVQQGGSTVYALLLAMTVLYGIIMCEIADTPHSMSGERRSILQTVTHQSVVVGELIPSNLDQTIATPPIR